MKDIIIKMGVSIGLDAKKVEEMYMKTYNEKFAETNDAAKSTQYTTIMLKRYLQNIHRKSSNLVEVEGVVLGNSITDWGQIMRRKHGNVYPEGHANEGKEIPEHDFNNNILLLNLNNNTIMTITQRSQDAEKVNSMKIPTGAKAKIKLEKGRKEGVLVWSDGISELEVIQRLTFKELQQLLMQHAKDYLCGVNDLCNPVQGVKIINADFIELDKRESRFGTAIIRPDDATVNPETFLKTIEIKMPIGAFDYPEDVKNVIIVCELMKAEDSVMTYKGYSAFADDSFAINAQKISDEKFV